MRAALSALCLVAWLWGGASASAQQCLQWGDSVELTGFVVEGIYPGPPEFASVSGGDEALKALLLHMPENLCIDGEDELADGPVAAIELVQLACVKLKMHPGDQVSVYGQLMPRHTGYHITPAVLVCD